MENASGKSRVVAERAAACAERMHADGAESPAAADSHIDALLAAIRELDARYAFDSQGRPSAIAAVRHALPSVERELLDAIVEDHACEVAALREAIYQVARAARIDPEA